MGRGKAGVPSLIQDWKKRMVTFKNRKKGLEKKAYELSTLCDVDIAMIMFGPDGMVKGTNDPMLWPEDPEVTNRLVNMYQSSPKFEHRHADVASIYQDRARIVGNEVEKLRKKNMEGKYLVWHEFYELLSGDDLLKLAYKLDCMLGVLQPKIDSMTQRVQELNSSNGLGNNEGALVLHNSGGMRMMDGSFSCFGHEGALVGHYFGNEDSLAFHNSRNMKIVDESSSFYNNFSYNNNNNNIVPANFDHMVTNINYDLLPLPGFEDNFVSNNDYMVMDQPENHQYVSYDLQQLPGFEDNFVWNNGDMVMDQQENHQYVSYESPQVQMPDFTPHPVQCIDPPSDPYSQMVNNDIGDARINQFGGNFNFQF